LIRNIEPDRVQTWPGFLIGEESDENACGSLNKENGLVSKTMLRFPVGKHRVDARKTRFQELPYEVEVARESFLRIDLMP